MIYNADDIVKFHASCLRNLKDGRWVLCRPESGPRIWRIKAAWLVLTGKCDALKWTEQ